MGVAVVLMAAEPEDLGVAPGFLSVLGRLGVTHVRVLRDDGGIALVLEGWAFDPASAGEVANMLRRPVDRVLRPLVDVALSDEVGGRSSVSTT
ncbi:MAG TPA: hypothetical protein VFO78_00490 [Candidatus Limnocylindrales bacterium]|nr:hypothetical protein [Candidatus Limnocylindrales bacterium]